MINTLNYRKRNQLLGEARGVANEMALFSQSVSQYRPIRPGALVDARDHNLVGKGRNKGVLHLRRA